MATNGNVVAKKHDKPELTLEHRRSIFFTCVQAELTVGFEFGFWKTLSSNLPVGARTVSPHWKKLREKCEQNVGPMASLNIHTMMNEAPDSFFETNKKVTGQNSRIWIAEHVGEALLEVPVQQRQCVSHTAAAIGVPKTSFHRLMKNEDAAVVHSNALKPYLNEANKSARVVHCLSKINPTTINSCHGPMLHKEDCDEINGDEKWFNLTHDGVRHCLACARREGSHSPLPSQGLC